MNVRLLLFTLLLTSVPFFASPATGADENSPSDDAHVWISDTGTLPWNETPLYRWDFSRAGDTAGWRALHECEISVLPQQNTLKISSQGTDPYLMTSTLPTGESAPPGESLCGHLMLKLRARGETCGSLSLYWTNTQTPHFSESATVHQNLAKTPESREFTLSFYSATPVTALRLDPGSSRGDFFVESLELVAVAFPPLEVSLMPHEKLVKKYPSAEAYFLYSGPQTMRLKLRNPSAEKSVTAMINGVTETFLPGETRFFPLTSDAKKPVDRLRWCVQMEGFPEIVREVSVLHHIRETEGWRQVAAPDFFSSQKNTNMPILILAAPDDSVYYIYSYGAFPPAGLPQPQKIIAAVENRTPAELRKYVTVSAHDTGLTFALAAEAGQCVELPVLHVFSPMTYAVLPGVELLETGEWSSSRLDIRTEAHKRFRPSPNLLTQQWMGIISTDAAFRLQWKNPEMQPAFAVPNYFDGTADARMSVFVAPGESVMLCITGDTPEKLALAGFAQQVLHHGDVADAAVREKTPAPETFFALYRKMLETGPIRNEHGWGHCEESHWGRYPFAGIASALYCVQGKIPEFSYFAPGGTHVENYRINFLYDRGDYIMAHWHRRAEDALRKRSETGAYVYDGGFAEGHFEKEALGTAAMPVYDLLFGYILTGEQKYLDAALQTLEYMKRYRLARGAQCWEMPLHTPDPLAAAYAVYVYTLAYRLTQDPAHLHQAYRWAAEGLTYVYWWDTPQRDFQFGATIGVLGATNWDNPLWIGRPVQWIGTVYAYGLLELADATDSLSETEKRLVPISPAILRNVAEQITLSAERQIYPAEDPSFGLLPDSVDPVTNVRYIYNINPSVPIFLRMRLMGKQDGLCLKWTDTRDIRVVSPFPVLELTSEKLIIQAPENQAFQIIINGQLRKIDAGPEKRILSLKP